MSVSRRRRSTLNSLQLISRACCESLESRRLLAADVWSGAGADTNFSDMANWTGGAVPTAGQAVTFPAGAKSLIVTVDMDETVGDVIIGAGYTLSPGQTPTTITLDGNIDETAGDTTINNPIVLGQTTTVTIAGAASLTLAGAISDGGLAFGITEASTGFGGTLILSSPDGETYTGPTNVNGGTLEQAADTTLTSTVTAAAGGTFVGDGTVNSLAASGGTLDASTGQGRNAQPTTITSTTGLAVTGTGSAMDFVIDGSGESSQFIVDAGTINLGDATLSLRALTFTPIIGEQITLISNLTGTPIVGTFAGLPQGATTVVGGEQYTVSYDSGGNNSVTLTASGEATTTTTVTLSKTPIYEGQTEIISARVITSAGVFPTGEVTFYENETPITFNGQTAQPLSNRRRDNGVVQITDAFLPVGTDQIYAVYDGQGLNSNSTSPPVTVHVRASTIPIIIGTITPGTGTATLDESQFLEEYVFPDAAVVTAATPATTHGVSVELALVANDPSYTNFESEFDPFLTYTWSAVHVPAGAKDPTYSVNGNNAASGIGGFNDLGITSNSNVVTPPPLIVHFHKDGGYILQCKVTDPSQQSAYADVYVTVGQKAKTLRIEPKKAQIPQGLTQQYTTTVLDQFGRPMRTAQNLSYSIASGAASGSISSTGLFFASNIDGAVTIEVKDDLLTGTVGAEVV